MTKNLINEILALRKKYGYKSIDLSNKSQEQLLQEYNILKKIDNKSKISPAQHIWYNFGGPVQSQIPSFQVGLFAWYGPGSMNLSTPKWTDLGSNGYDLTKTLTNNPVTGTAIDGYTSYNFSGLAALKNLNSSLSQSFTVYTVFRTGIQETTMLFQDGHTSTNRVTLQAVSGGIFRANAGSNLSTAAGVLKKDMVHLVRATINGANSSLWVIDMTGSALATGNAGSTNLGGLTVGAGNTGANAFSEDIVELVYYTGSHNSASVQDYFYNKYPSILKYNWQIKDVLMLGDSITLGIGSTHGHGCRNTIRENFETNDILNGSKTLRFVGSQRDGCMSHYGISGKSIIGLSGSASAQVSIYAPTFVNLLIGTNDCQGDDGVFHSGSASVKYTSLMSVLSNSSPNIPYVICTIPPLSNASHNSNVNSLNSILTGSIIPTFQSGGMQIYTCDLNFSLSVGDLADGVHPNDAGYVKMGNALDAVWRTLPL